MHPSFLFTDHKVGTSPVHTPVPRRSRPARLDLATPTVGWPPVPLVVPAPPPPAGPHLFIVPVPPDHWRARLGGWLIRAGQRIMMTQRAG